MTEPRSPAPVVTVVIAAYNRAAVLRHALKSALAQDLADIEVLVIGDACTDDSEAVCASFRDPRVTFVNLPRNYGEQSGPNNVGVARARGRYIAFLNQDDFWLKDHLSVAVEWIEATGADLVHALTASITPGDRSKWRAGLDCMVTGDQFNPYFDFAPASTWLVRPAVFARIGGFRPALECVCETSQDFLFRAWRSGLVHRLVPNLSVLVLASSVRPGSYVDSTSPEHELLAEEMARKSDFRAELLRRVIAPATPGRLKKLRRVAERIALAPFAWCGIPPRAVRYRLQGGYRRGDWINHLHRIRGLSAIDASAESLLGRLRVQEMLIGPRYRLGDKVEFGLQSKQASVKQAGWGMPEALATWTVTSEATLAFPLGPEKIVGDLELCVEARPYANEQHPRQRVEFLVGESSLARFDLGAKEPVEPLRVRIPEACLASGELLRVAIRLPDAVSPRQLKISSDQRTLGLSVRSVRLSAAAPGSLLAIDNQVD